MSDDVAVFDPDTAISVLAADLLRGVDCATFRGRAAQLSVGMEVEDLEDLRFRLHRPPPEPSEYDFRKHGLGGWLSACQFAIFELVFCLGPPALPFLREIAWGPYDWTQGNAIEMLIRLAAQGAQTEQTAAEIAQKFPSMRYEAQLYTLEPLLPAMEGDPALASLIRRLRAGVPAFDQVACEIEGRTPPR
ncbi:MAG: hypothetical protein AAF661_18090 [Pseudomonadota bacterium]